MGWPEGQRNRRHHRTRDHRCGYCRTPRIACTSRSETLPCVVADCEGTNCTALAQDELTAHGIKCAARAVVVCSMSRRIGRVDHSQECRRSAQVCDRLLDASADRGRCLQPVRVEHRCPLHTYLAPTAPSPSIHMEEGPFLVDHRLRRQVGRWSRSSTAGRKTTMRRSLVRDTLASCKARTVPQSCRSRPSPAGVPPAVPFAACLTAFVIARDLESWQLRHV